MLSTLIIFLVWWNVSLESPSYWTNQFSCALIASWTFLIIDWPKSSAVFDNYKQHGCTHCSLAKKKDLRLNILITWQSFKSHWRFAGSRVLINLTKSTKFQFSWINSLIPTEIRSPENSFIFPQFYLFT